MPEPIDYAAVLADLERKRDELTRLIDGLRAFSGVAAPSGGSPSGGGGSGASTTVEQPNELRSDSFFGMNAPQAIKAYLGMVKQPKTVREIADGLTAGGFLTSATKFYNNLYTALVRMEGDGEVVRLPHKKWGLTEWYPGRNIKKRPASASDKGPDGGSVGDTPRADDGETAA